MDKTHLEVLRNIDENMKESGIRPNVVKFIMQQSTPEGVNKSIQPIRDKMNKKEIYFISIINSFPEVLEKIKSSQDRVKSSETLTNNIIKQMEDKIKLELKEEQERLRKEKELEREKEEERNKLVWEDGTKEEVEIWNTYTPESIQSEMEDVNDEDYFNDGLEDLLSKLEDHTVDIGSIPVIKIEIPISDYKFPIYLVDNDDKEVMQILDTQQHDIYFLWVYPEMEPVKNLPMLMKFMEDYGSENVEIPLNVEEEKLIESRLLKNLLTMNTKV